jgi:hypothetical protein
MSIAGYSPKTTLTNPKIIIFLLLSSISLFHLFMIISLGLFSHAPTLLTFQYFFHSRFCVGDKYYLCDNKILCPYDYEERLVFAGLAENPSNLAHMKRQLNNLQVILFPCLVSQSIKLFTDVSIDGLGNIKSVKFDIKVDWCKSNILFPLSSLSLSNKHTISINIKLSAELDRERRKLFPYCWERKKFRQNRIIFIPKNASFCNACCWYCCCRGGRKTFHIQSILSIKWSLSIENC